MVKDPYIIAFPPGYRWLSANDRQAHWAQRHKIVKQIKNDTKTLARAARIPPLEVVRIHAWVHPRDRRHQDADNAQPTVKAVVDALVELGILIGDDQRFVLETTYQLGQPITSGQLEVYLWPVDFWERT